MRIVVQQGWRSDQIARREDCIVNFAHANWSGPLVAVFVDGGYCGQFKVAYDVHLRGQVDFALVAGRLRESIVKAYGVTPAELAANDGDVFQWATYPGDGVPRRSTQEFHRRFPGI